MLTLPIMVHKEEKVKQKAKFACHAALYQFNIMPFRLTDAPEFFQYVMLIELVAPDMRVLLLFVLTIPTGVLKYVTVIIIRSKWVT